MMNIPMLHRNLTGEFVMRTVTATLLAASLMVSSAFADTQSLAPLPSGKPAGVKQATMEGSNFFLLLLSAGIVIGGIVLAVSNGNKNGVTTPTTTATGTSLP
jgi:hypothetical protein